MGRDDVNQFRHDIPARWHLGKKMSLVGFLTFFMTTFWDNPIVFCNFALKLDFSKL